MTRKKKNRRKLRRHERSPTIELSSSPSPPPTIRRPNQPKSGTIEMLYVSIASYDDYYKVVMQYINEEHWLATETVAPLFSLQHEHCKCPFLQVSYHYYIPIYTVNLLVRRCQRISTESHMYSIKVRRHYYYAPGLYLLCLQEEILHSLQSPDYSYECIWKRNYAASLR